MAMNTKLECNLTEREVCSLNDCGVSAEIKQIIEEHQSGESQISAGNKKVIGVEGGHLITVEETSESSGWENELVCSPPSIL